MPIEINSLPTKSPDDFNSQPVAPDTQQQELPVNKPKLALDYLHSFANTSLYAASGYPLDPKVFMPNTTQPDKPYIPLNMQYQPDYLEQNDIKKQTDEFNEKNGTDVAFNPALNLTQDMLNHLLNISGEQHTYANDLSTSAKITSDLASQVLSYVPITAGASFLIPEIPYMSLPLLSSIKNPIAKGFVQRALFDAGLSVPMTAIDNVVNKGIGEKDRESYLGNMGIMVGTGMLLHGIGLGGKAIYNKYFNDGNHNPSLAEQTNKSVAGAILTDKDAAAVGDAVQNTTGTQSDIENLKNVLSDKQSPIFTPDNTTIPKEQPELTPDDYINNVNHMVLNNTYIGENFKNADEVNEFLPKMFSEKAVDTLQNKYNMHIVSTQDDLPVVPTYPVHGITLGKDIYIVANNHTPFTLFKTINHELSHLIDLKSLMGEKNYNIVSQFFANKLDSGELSNNLSLKRIPNFDKLPRDVQIDEAIAYAISDNPNHSIFSSSYVNAKLLLHKMGLTNLNDYDISAMINGAIHKVIQGKIKPELRTRETSLNAIPIINGINPETIDNVSKDFEKQKKELVIKFDNIKDAQNAIKELTPDEFKSVYKKSTGEISSRIKELYPQISPETADKIADTITSNVKEYSGEKNINWKDANFVRDIKTKISSDLHKEFGEITKDKLEQVYKLNDIDLVRNTINEQNISKITSDTLKGVLNNTEWQTFTPNTLKDITKHIDKYVKENQPEKLSPAYIKNISKLKNDLPQILRDTTKKVILQAQKDKEFIGLNSNDVEIIKNELNTRIKKAIKLQDTDFDVGDIKAVKSAFNPEKFSSDIVKRYKDALKDTEFKQQSVISKNELRDKLLKRYGNIEGFTKEKATTAAKVIIDEVNKSLASGKFINNDKFLDELMSSEKIRDAINPDSDYLIQRANDLLNLENIDLHDLANPTQTSYEDHITDTLIKNNVNPTTARAIANRATQKEMIWKNNNKDKNVKFGENINNSIQSVIDEYQKETVSDLHSKFLNAQATLNGLNIMHNKSHLNTIEQMPSMIMTHGAASTDGEKNTIINAVFGKISGQLGQSLVNDLLTNTDQAFNNEIMRTVWKITNLQDVSNVDNKIVNIAKVISNAFIDMMKIEKQNYKLTPEKSDYLLSGQLTHDPIAMKDMTLKQFVEHAKQYWDIKKMALDNNTTEKKIINFLENGELFTQLKLGTSFQYSSGPIDLSKLVGKDNDELIKNINAILNDAAPKNDANLINQGNKPSWIQFKDIDSQISYLNLVNHNPYMKNVWDTLYRRASQVAMIKTLGAQPQKVLDFLVEQAKQLLATQPNSVSRIEALEKNTKTLLSYTMGTYHTPATGMVEKMIHGAVNYARNLAIWSGIKSMFTDPVAHALYTHATYGTSLTKEIAKNYISLVKYLANSKYRDYLMTLSTQQDLYNTHYLVHNPSENFINHFNNKLSNYTHTFSGQAGTANANRTHSNLVNMIYFDKYKDTKFIDLPQPFLNRLIDNGWTQQEWEKFGKSVKPIDDREHVKGQYLLQPSDIKDNTLRDKYRGTLIQLSSEPYYHIPKIDTSAQSPLSMKTFAPYKYSSSPMIRGIVNGLAQFQQYSANLFRTTVNNSMNIGKNSFTGHIDPQSVFLYYLKSATTTAVATMLAYETIHYIKHGKFSDSKSDLAAAGSEGLGLPVQALYALNLIHYHSSAAPATEMTTSLGDALYNIYALGKDATVGEGRGHGSGSARISDYDYHTAKLTKDAFKLVPQAAGILDILNFMSFRSLEGMKPEYMQNYDRYLKSHTKKSEHYYTQ